MIRKALVEDLPRIHACASEFYAASKFLRRFNLERFVSAWTDFLETGVGTVFVAEDGGEVTGCIGGVVYPDLYSGTLVATEFFWYVRERHRGAGVRLYHAFEDWARERRCSEIRMVHLTDSMPERLAKVYRRFGYEASEVHYVKELT
jgi:GNAT superfamily N-acetyltransferase